MRYALGDLAYLVGRGLTLAAERVRGAGAWSRRSWMRLSLATRKRLAVGAGVAALAALLWFAILPALPCQFPAGDVCPPADDAAAVVPGDTLAYVHTNVDPETEQFAAAAEISRTLPSITTQVLSALPEAVGRPIDFGGQVRPWHAGEIALALVPGQGGRPQQVLLFEVADETRAREFADSIAAGPPTERDYEGVEVRVDDRGDASAIAGGFLLLGSESAVERSLDVIRGEERSLASAPLGEQVLDELPDDSLVQVALSEEGVTTILADGGEDLESLEAFVNFEASLGAGAALVAEEAALELFVYSQLDPEQLESASGFFAAFPAFEPSLTDELGPDTLGYLGLGDPATSIEDLFSQATAQAPGIALGFSDVVEDLRRRGQIDVQEEVLPLLEGEAALAIEPGSTSDGDSGEVEPESEPQSPPLPGQAPELEPGSEVVQPSGAPRLTLIAEEVDTEPARETLAKLQGPLAEALDPSRAQQSPVFTDREIDGVEAHSLRLSRTVDLTYALFDERLVVSSDPQGIARLRTGERGLSGAEAFERATEDMPEEPSLLVYLNLSALVALAEQEGLAEDPAYALFATDIRRLLAMGLAVERGRTTLETTLRIPIEG